MNDTDFNDEGVTRAAGSAEPPTHSPVSAYEDAFRDVPVGMYIIQDGKFCFVNPQFQKITGYDADELLGMNAVDLVLPVDRKTVKENAAKMLRGDRTTPYEHSFLTKDGKTRQAAQMVRSINYKGKRATLGSFMDITDLGRVAESLRRSERRFYTVFRSSPDWVVISALKDGFYVDVNETFLRMTGYRRDEVIGRTSEELGIWANPRERKETMQALEEEGSIQNIEVHFRMRSGQIRNMLWSAELIDFGGEQCLLAVARDITERKEAEEERLQQARQKGTAVLVTQLGLTMVGSILFCFAIGYYLDKWLGTKALFITIFIILGVVGGGYNAYRQIMETTQLDKKRKGSK
jgi:PAS domain S-box-containing protein